MDFSHENPIDFDIDSIIMNQSRRKIHFMDYSWLIIISTKWMFEKMEKKNKIPEIKRLRLQALQPVLPVGQ